MKTRLIALIVLLAATTALFAQEKKTRTIVVRDGKVITDTGEIPFGDFVAGKRAFLGVSLMDLSPELREHFGASKASGILVESVEDNSPADKAGLRVGDVITAVDGKDVESSWELRRALRGKKDNDTVRIEYVRNGARQTAVATLVERDMPRIVVGGLDELPFKVGEAFKSPEWRARVESLQDCGQLQSKIQELEKKMKELEKKLQK